MPKLKQLEQLQLELDNDEENLKIKNGLLNRSLGGSNPIKGIYPSVPR